MISFVAALLAVRTFLPHLPPTISLKHSDQCFRVHSSLIGCYGVCNSTHHEVYVKVCALMLIDIPTEAALVSSVPWPIAMLRLDVVQSGCRSVRRFSGRSAGQVVDLDGAAAVESTEAGQGMKACVIPSAKLVAPEPGPSSRR